MKTNRPILALAGAAAIAAIACTGSATLNLALHDRGDPSPRKLEIGAQVAGLCLGFILSWSGGDARPTAGY